MPTWAPATIVMLRRLIPPTPRSVPAEKAVAGRSPLSLARSAFVLLGPGPASGPARRHCGQASASSARPKASSIPAATCSLASPSVVAAVPTRYAARNAAD